MKILRALMKEKGQAAGSGLQSDVAQPDQRRYEPTYPSRFTPLYTQMLPITRMRGFLYGYTPPLIQVNDMGQNSWANAADPIAILDLDDPKERIRKELVEQSENIEAQRKLELIEQCLKVMEGSYVYSLVDVNKMSLVLDLMLL